MGLDYIDLYLAHWPHAEKSISREALENAKASPTASKAERGILTETRNGNENASVIDWEHTSANIAKLAGMYNVFCIASVIYSPLTSPLHLS